MCSQQCEGSTACPALSHRPKTPQHAGLRISCAPAAGNAAQAAAQNHNVPFLILTSTLLIPFIRRTSVNPHGEEHVPEKHQFRVVTPNVLLFLMDAQTGLDED